MDVISRHIVDADWAGAEKRLEMPHPWTQREITEQTSVMISRHNPKHAIRTSSCGQLFEGHTRNGEHKKTAVIHDIAGTNYQVRTLSRYEGGHVGPQRRIKVCAEVYVGDMKDSER